MIRSLIIGSWIFLLASAAHAAGMPHVNPVTSTTAEKSTDSGGASAHSHWTAGTAGDPFDSSTTDAAGDVRAAAEAALAARFPDVSHRLDVRVLRFGNVSEKTAIRIEAAQFDGVPRGRTQVRLLVEEAGTWTEAGWALLFVAHFDSVAFVTRDVGANEPIRTEDLDATWIETTAFRGDPLRNEEAVALLESGELYATTAMKTGDVVRVRDVRPAFAAETGSSVVMTYRRGAVVLQLACRARESGFLGEVIRLYNPETRATYRARLVAPGRAEWVNTL